MKALRKHYVSEDVHVDHCDLLLPLALPNVEDIKLQPASVHLSAETGVLAHIILCCPNHIGVGGALSTVRLQAGISVFSWNECYEFASQKTR